MIDRAEARRLAGELKDLRQRLRGGPAPAVPAPRRALLRVAAACAAAVLLVLAVARVRPSARPLPVDRAVGLSADEGFLYVADAERRLLYRLEPGAMKAAMIRPLAVGSVAGLAVGAGAAWTTDGSGRVGGPEPGRPSAPAERFALPGVAADALHAAGGTLYVIDGAARSLRTYRLGRSLEPVASLSLAGRLPFGAKPAGLVVDKTAALIAVESPASVVEVPLPPELR